MGDIPALEIYLDILFLLNFIMDYFIFWLVGKVTRQKISRIRLCIGSFIGALLYCLLVILPILRTVNIWLYLILLPILPIKIIFRTSGIKQVVQFYVISNIIALAVGGIGFALFHMVQDGSVIGYVSKQSNNSFTAWILIISIIISYIMLRLFSYYMKKRNIGIQKLYSLRILCNGDSVNMEALLDTGNKVYDPITKYPVIIVEYGMLESLLPPNIRSAYLSTKEDITLLVQEASKSSFAGRIRIIPYNSLGNPNGILLGFKPDDVLVKYNQESWKSMKNVIIAIYKYDLDTQRTYHALLHADLVCEI